MNAHSKFFLFFIALASAMGGFLFGYDWVVIGGAKPFYEQFFEIEQCLDRLSCRSFNSGEI